MKLFFEVIIKRPDNNPAGKMKNFSYIVEAMSYSEAERDAYKIAEIEEFNNKDFSIEKITKLDVTNVYKRDYDEEHEDNFYCQTKCVSVGIDERTGKEVVFDNFNYLVLTSEFPSVVTFLEDLHNELDIRICSQKRTNIYSVYFSETLNP